MLIKSYHLDCDQLQCGVREQRAHDVAAAPVRGGHGLRDSVLHHQSGVLIQPGPTLNEIHYSGE